MECGLASWVVTLKDHESRLQAALEVERLDDLLPALEEALARGRIAWKAFKSHRRKEKPPKDGK